MPPKSRKSFARMLGYAAKKPVAITSDGKFVLPAEVESGGTVSFGMGIGSLHSLDTSLQQKLTLQRVKLDPKYDLGIFQMGRFPKDEVVAHVEKLTHLGKRVIHAEMTYCTEFLNTSAKKPTLLTKPVKPNKPPLQPIKPPPIKPPLKPIKIKNTALFLEETDNPITHNAAAWRIAHVHPVFVSRGFNVVSLEGANDTRANFVVEAKKPFVVYISGVGHGNTNLYTGHNGDYILVVGSYDPAEVKPKVMHLLSCLTAQQLGKDVVAKGARAYAGYFQEYHLILGGTNEVLFYSTDGTFDISMANGSTVQQARDATVAAFTAAIASVPNTSTAVWLTYDLNWFRTPVEDAVYGDKNAIISPTRVILIPVPFTVEQLVEAA